jgi:hypothetical protein
MAHNDRTVNATRENVEEIALPPPANPRRRWVVLGAVVAVAAVIVALAVGLELTAYVPDETRSITLSPDPEMTKRAILHEVPMGCNQYLARDVMQINGFRCGMRYNEAFYTTRWNGTAIEDFPRQNYLYCTKSEPLVVGISELRWRIAIVVKKNVVNSVYVDVTELSTP